MISDYCKHVLARHFDTLPDPRIQRTKRHQLLDVLFIAICAMICGAETFTDMEEFAARRWKVLSAFLGISGNVPSHDTFGRIFALLDPQAFSQCFLQWTQELAQRRLPELQSHQDTGHQDTGAAQHPADPKTIHLDGKVNRHTFNRTTGCSAINMVSAWCAQSRLVLGQYKVHGKSNEITAIPQLLAMLDIRDCTITIDAIGTQVEIAQQIIAQGGHYILRAKDNQKELHKEVKSTFVRAFHDKMRDAEGERVPLQTCKSVEKGHGRIEIRKCFMLAAPDWLIEEGRWAGIKTVIMVHSTRTIKDTTSREVRYYISSRDLDVVGCAKAIRSHWGIENSVHYILDVTFDEDASRIRTGNAPQNVAVVRHIALNLLQSTPDKKRSIRRKRLAAAWDDDYLIKILTS
jgi:predicted transposase YbfD/YdcC